MKLTAVIVGATVVTVSAFSPAANNARPTTFLNPTHQLGGYNAAEIDENYNTAPPPGAFQRGAYDPNQPAPAVQSSIQNQGFTGFGNEAQQSMGANPALGDGYGASGDSVKSFVKSDGFAGLGLDGQTSGGNPSLGNDPNGRGRKRRMLKNAFKKVFRLS